MIGYFFLTLQNIVLPLFLQIAAGFLLKKLLKFSIEPLVNIQFYLIIPALLFTSMYEMVAGTGLFWMIILHAFLLVALLHLIGLLVARILKYPAARTGAMLNSICLYNSGNFGIPLVQMLYNANPLAMSIQMIVMMSSNILTNTLGIYNANRSSKSFPQTLLSIFKVPMIYTELCGRGGLLTTIISSITITLTISLLLYLNL
jgi:predicted permease